MIKLSKILPISNAEIERAFSSFSYIKNKLRTKLTNENCNDFLFIYRLKISQKDFD